MINFENRVFSKIIVTGGAGFIGSNFMHLMIDKYPETDFVVVDKLTYAGNLANLEPIMQRKNFKFVQADIRDFEKMCELIDENSCIVNFAAESHVDNSITGPKIFTDTNVLGTHMLLEAARNKKVGLFIQISTDEVYGSLGFESKSSTENDILKPSSPYSASKAAAEMLCMAYMHTFKMPIIITRSSNNFGPYQYPEKMIPLFITNLIDGKKVPLYGTGKNIRDWIYVVDNCEAIDFIIRKGILGEIYNIGGGNEIQNIYLTNNLLSKIGFGSEMIEYVQDRLGHDLRYSLDSNKIKKLGWMPKNNFESALLKTIEWYKNNSKWWITLKNKNVKTKKNRYLIIGNGYLGNRLKEYLGEEAYLIEGKINNIQEIVDAITRLNCDIVINCAGKTGKPNVDACESIPEETFFGNVMLPWMIAEACRKTGKKMVHYGTGCTYEGNNFFSEDDEPNFRGSLYSRTKLIAEKLLSSYLDVLQIRLRIPLDDRISDRNLIDKLLKYARTGGKILIAENSITPVPFLMETTKRLIEMNKTGLFNVVAKGSITHDFILDEYQKLSGEKLNYQKISAAELDKMTAARRSNCTLSTNKLESEGIRAPDVKDAVIECIKGYILSKSRSSE